MYFLNRHDNMLHRECEPRRPDQPFVRKAGPNQPLPCEKGFPKPYQEVTVISDNGHPLDRRRPNPPYRKPDGTYSRQLRKSERPVWFLITCFLLLYFLRPTSTPRYATPLLLFGQVHFLKRPRSLLRSIGRTDPQTKTTSRRAVSRAL